MATNNSSNIKTAASGKIIQGQGVGSAPDFSTAVYPSTAGTSGNFLASDGTNFVSSPSPGLFALIGNPEWFDDFVWDSTISGDVGELGWSLSTASSAFAVNRSSSVRTGICELSTGSATAKATINSGTTSLACGLGTITYQSSINLTNLSDGTDTYKVYIGLYGNTSMNSTSVGVYFTYTNGENSGKWLLNTSSANGVNTTLDSGVTVATGWVQLSFVVNADATSVEFFINGVSVGTMTTTIPQTTNFTEPFFGITRSLGSNTRVLQIDYFYMKYALTSAR